MTKLPADAKVELVALALRTELERQQIPMSEPRSDPLKHMAIIYRSPAVSLLYLAEAAIAALEQSDAEQGEEL
jgi:hypothetical protein